MIDNGLKDSFVTLYLDGGWCIFGIVMECTESDITLDTKDGIFIGLRNKISGILFMNEKNDTEDINIKDTKERTNRTGYNIASVGPLDDTGNMEFENNEIGHGNQYGSLIPADMLLEGESDIVTDFAINFSTIGNTNDSSD